MTKRVVVGMGLKVSSEKPPIVVPIGNKHLWIKAECRRLAIEILERSYGYDC